MTTGANSNMTIKNSSYFSVMLVTCVMGCATTAAPQELVDARAAYAQGVNGKAQRLNPAGLHEAKVALDRAESSFSDQPSSSTTKDLAYIAWRRAQRAELEATTSDWEAQRVAAESSAASAQAQQAKKTESELAAAKQQLESERAARQIAESRTKEVLDQLVAANASAVRQEPRGTVISLSGGVLFASGQSQVLPGAQSSLNQIAEVIAADPSKKIAVEGHTDSRGAPESNLALSQARAQAVAQYLIAHGVQATRVSANGLGASRPIADNESAEGRASNRRVEIVIQTLEAR